MAAEERAGDAMREKAAMAPASPSLRYPATNRQAKMPSFLFKTPYFLTGFGMQRSSSDAFAFELNIVPCSGDGAATCELDALGLKISKICIDPWVCTLALTLVTPAKMPTCS